MKNLKKLKKEFLKVQQNSDAKRIVYPVKLRLKVMKALESGFTQYELTQTLGIGKMTIAKWCEKYSNNLPIQVFPEIKEISDLKITSPNGYIISGLTREDIYAFLNMARS